MEIQNREDSSDFLPSPAARRGSERDTMDPDFTDPLVFRAAGKKRFSLPLFEGALVIGLTLIFLVQGGYAHYEAWGGPFAAIGAILFLILIGAGTLVHLDGVRRYSVRVDEQGVTVLQGLLRRQVRWDEAFIAQWLAHRTGNEDGDIHTTWTMEIRDAAGTVKLRVDGAMLEQHDRRLLEQMVNHGLQRQRLLWLQQEDTTEETNES